MPNRTDSTLTVFPQSERFGKPVPQKRPAQTELHDSREVSRARFLQPRKQQPRLPLQVNDASLFGNRLVPQSVPAPSQTLRNGQEALENPSRYRGILEEDQAGDCTVAYQMTADFPVVVLKKRVMDNGHRSPLTLSYHANLCNLQDFFEETGTIWMVYECLDVSLEDIQTSPAASFKEYELAAIATEVCVRKHTLV